jgi:hypothetical protein
MVLRHQLFRRAFCAVTILIFCSSHLYGQLTVSALTKLYKPTVTATSNGETDSQFTDNFDDQLSKPQESKQLLTYLKELKVENSSNASQAKARFYYRLANTFARLRLYPLAMKCFLKTIPKQGSSIIKADSLKQPVTVADTDDLGDANTEKYLTINSNDDSLINYQSSALAQNNSPVKSKAITYQRIHQTFDDGKKAIAYAMLFHVKQPVRGRRKIFVLNNVGHTFITLIKYNSDSTYTSVSFGFYPKKNNLLSATPLIPATSSVFKDDSGHGWDEVLGKFISRKRFEKIQGLILKYDGVKYNLSKNNCTDFGIKAAQLAGIGITETYGTWPLGKGNNPAVTGQSILAHQFFTTDGTNAQSIFVNTIAQSSK